jgi:hypothetical protein
VGALTNTQRQLLVCLAARVVPESASMAGSPRAQMLFLIDEALAARPPAMQRQFGRFLIVLRWAPLLRYLRPLDRLDPRRQDAVLRWFQDCPFQTVRSGFWGVRTLIFIGYYGRPDVGPDVAYFPAADGNAVLHARSRR